MLQTRCRPYLADALTNRVPRPDPRKSAGHDVIAGAVRATSMPVYAITMSFISRPLEGLAGQPGPRAENRG